MTERQLNGWEALVDVMVQHYKTELEAANERISRLDALVKECQDECKALRKQYERLEEYTDEQERRADVLHEVVERFIDSSTREVARDLLGELNAVAENNGIDIDINTGVDELMYDSDETVWEDYMTL